jgi:hypothetical protein
VEIFFAAGYAPDQIAAGTQLAVEESSPGWEPGETIAQYSYFIDPNDNVQMQTAGPTGTTGTEQPTWATTPGSVTADNSASWMCLGPVAGEWDPQANYVQYATVFDGNGNLQTCIVEELVSQRASPAFATAMGSTTVDNGQTAWRCLGPYQGTIPSPPQQPSSYSKVINIPEDIVMAIQLMTSHFYRNREPVAGGTVSKVPHAVDDIIWAVRDLGFGPAANLTQ